MFTHSDAEHFLRPLGIAVAEEDIAAAPAKRPSRTVERLRAELRELRLKNAALLELATEVAEDLAIAEMQRDAARKCAADAIQKMRGQDAPALVRGAR